MLRTLSALLCSLIVGQPTVAQETLSNDDVAAHQDKAGSPGAISNDDAASHTNSEFTGLSIVPEINRTSRPAPQEPAYEPYVQDEGEEPIRREDDFDETRDARRELPEDYDAEEDAEERLDEQIRRLGSDPDDWSRVIERSHERFRRSFDFSTSRLVAGSYVLILASDIQSAYEHRDAPIAVTVSHGSGAKRQTRAYSYSPPYGAINFHLSEPGHINFYFESRRDRSDVESHIAFAILERHTLQRVDVVENGGQLRQTSVFHFGDR